MATPKTSGKPLISVGAWTQYVLDNYSTVAEAVEALSKEPFASRRARTSRRKEGGRPSRARRRLGRQRDLRIHRRQARHPPRPQIHGDDQLADLRPAAGDQHLLEGHQRAQFPARDDQLAGSVRPHELEPQRCAEGEGSEACSRDRLLADPLDLGSARPSRPGQAQHRRHDLADGVRHRRQALFFRNPSYSPSIFWVDLAKLKLATGSAPAGSISAASLFWTEKCRTSSSPPSRSSS